MATIVAHKFGGTSMGDPARIKNVAEILRARKDQETCQVVVVSAMSGVTDALINLCKQAAAKDPAWKDGLEALGDKHKAAAEQLATPIDPVHDRIETELRSLHDLLHAQGQVGALSDDILDLVQGLGEVWSSLLLDAHFRKLSAPSVWVDAREVLVIDKDELGAAVDYGVSREKLVKLAGETPARAVITGFIARNKSGRITTLGRNGSDYSGAIFANLFGAQELHIWTDVDGVLSADPRLVSEAVLLDRMSYDEACELAYFGAKVVHPQTMAPAFAKRIPIWIRNTFAPEKPGTRIDADTDVTVPVKGITTFTGLALLNLEGAGMLGVPGTAERCFAALKRAGASVVMISQGSSEHSICAVVQERDAEKARTSIREAFSRELAAGQIADVVVTPGIAALAIVGDGMAGVPGVAARLFSALARAQVNVRAIAQGSSERNISVAIAMADATRALRAVHAAFYLSAQTLSIGLIGPGNVGGAVLRQIEAARDRLKTSANLDLRVRAVARSKTMTLDGAEAPVDLARFAEHVNAEHLPHAVIIDCSASDAVPESYAKWLERGIHVITPNKNAGAGALPRFEAIRAASTRGARFRYEATVGAGLPIITTLRDLLDTGDEVLAIEGIFSGTLAYLFNTYDGTQPFSALVRQAKELGYTEPDPRDDLSGRDVAKKLVILAREIGWKATIESVRLESLVPEPLRGVSVDEFSKRLPELDAPMKARLDGARPRVLRYVARLDAGGAAHVGLTALDPAHPFAKIRLTDNIVQFTTKRYRDNPLIVQGPGAGPEVTAAGVFADLLRIASSLGAHI
ncbi:MAG: bifunctional aspartate kinase/homoserine dehydrogenase I [Myxococcaceae bacterium]|nr:bifunctional aspartate kinase/homoserine dehydrogenase I [Myxococcaceae bacterium]